MRIEYDGAAPREPEAGDVVCDGDGRGPFIVTNRYPSLNHVGVCKADTDGTCRICVCLRTGKMETLDLATSTVVDAVLRRLG